MDKKVKDLREESSVDGTFLVMEKELREFITKEGQYLQVKLGDSSGSIWAKCWEKAEEINSLFEVGDVIHIRGIVKSFRGKPQVIFEPKMVEKCTIYDITEYLPTTTKNIDALFAEIEKIARSLENEYLKSLLFSFLDDENFVTLFKKAPSAKVHHHNYIGGLIEHTHSVLSLCKAICELYPELDRDLLLAGAILHDIGKITTYEYTTHIDVTEKGGLMEHIVLGYRMVEEKIKTIEKFPEELELRLLHIILSHHSYGEWGSPVKPMFEEAVALSYIDMLDSQLKEFIQVKKKEDERRIKGVWSSFSRRFDRFFYLGRGYSKEQEQKISEMKDGNTER